MRATAQHWETGDSLENHAALIRRQVEASLQDPQTRLLAAAITSGSFDDYRDPRTGQSVPVVPYHGRYYRGARDWRAAGRLCGMRDELCEITQIWNFWVLNVRYAQDVAGEDTYAALRSTLEAGSGDCFPGGTLVLRDDGLLVPIEYVRVGDRVHDGERFVSVLKTWERGSKEITALGLDNGCTLRLTPNHKVLRMPTEQYVGGRDRTLRIRPLAYGSEEECQVGELRVGDFLCQPREFAGGTAELSADDALILAAYVAEGHTYRRAHGWGRADIAGTPGRKGVRERVEAVLRTRGLDVWSGPTSIRVSRDAVPVLQQDLGGLSATKRLPHVAFEPRTAQEVLATLDATDGGHGGQNDQNALYSTRSYELALQYRVLQRVLGRSSAMRVCTKHVGKTPLYRVRVRNGHDLKPFAQIVSLGVERESAPAYDIMTESGRVYLPESDVIVRQCDDFTIGLAALCGAMGYHSIARVISVRGDSWEHVYPVIKTRSGWLPLDATEKGKKPGWEYKRAARRKDFALV